MTIRRVTVASLSLLLLLQLPLFTLLNDDVRIIENTSPRRHIYIVAQGRGGRLGNKLFQYASTYGVYRQRLEQPGEGRNNMNFTIHFCIDPRFRFPSLHSTLTGPWAPDCPFSKQQAEQVVIPRPEKGYAMYQEFDITTSVACNSTLSVSLKEYSGNQEEICYFSLGEYMQSFKYFQHVEPELRKIFRFQPSIQQEADKIINQTTTFIASQQPQSNDAVTLVAVHVRRSTARWMKAAPTSFFAKAMSYFREKYNMVASSGNDDNNTVTTTRQRVHFLVASDDKEWCREQAVFQSNDVTILPLETSPSVDMAILAKCHHAIISVGTFGWWSAWFTGGNVVCYKHALVWYAKKNWFVVKLNDYYPPHWRAMA